MSEHNIEVQGGSAVRLKTAGKYCDRDIVVTAQGGGADTGMEDMLVSEDFTEYSNDRVTKLRTGAFACSRLQAVHLPAVTHISEKAFYGNARLKTVDIPNAVSIGADAFSHALNSDSNYSFPSVKTVAYSAFASSSFDTVHLPVAETLGRGCFSYCTLTKEINAPCVKELDSATCERCVSLEKVNFEAAESIDSACFSECRSLATVVFPSAKTVGMAAFYACENLEIVDFTAIEAIKARAFLGCTSLKAVIIRNESTVCVCDLTAFDESAVFEGRGFVYIPSSMWDYYAAGYGDYIAVFRVLEDYTVDGTITGDLDESKI